MGTTYARNQHFYIGQCTPRFTWVSIILSWTLVSFCCEVLPPSTPVDALVYVSFAKACVTGAPVLFV